MMPLSTTDRLLAANALAMRHVLSERTNDVDQVMPTISDTVCYLMPDVSSPDSELMVLTERDQVRDFYGGERRFMEIVDATMLVELTSDWYTFLEAVSTTRQVETGTLHHNDVAVLFPLAPDGIVGEILLTRRPWVEAYASTTPAPGTTNDIGDPDSPRCRAQRNHARFLELLRTGDIEGLSEVFTPDAEIAVRDPRRSEVSVLQGRGLDRVRERVRAIVGGVTDREIHTMNRVVGDWYVFAEWLVRGRATPLLSASIAVGDPVEIRCASLFVLAASGRIAGERGFCLVTPRAG
jgi:hypothetical protein